MKYREFGKTGERVSALGFGLMRLPVIGMARSKIDEEKAGEMFRDPAAVMRYNTFLEPKEKSSNCIECGICLDKCPQQIHIPDELKNVNELFGRSGVDK